MDHCTVRVRPMKISGSRLISVGGWLLWQMCTAATKLAEAKAKHSRGESSLYRKLSSLEMAGGSVSQTLNQYILEGKAIRKQELQRCVRKLRNYRCFWRALEIMEWMELRKINYSYHDFAVYLDLISLTKGVVAAENYFNGLPPPAKNKFTYGALLSCYCRELMADKALSLFKKMDELNYVNYLAFNNLMSLYMRLGKPESVPPLIDDLKQRKIPMDAITYHIWMNSYASSNDIEGVERVYEEMKKEDKDKIIWQTHSILAAIYVKAKDFEKAEEKLKMVENLANPRDRDAYHCLLSLYAGTSNRGEVYRIWNSLKSVSPLTNMSYLTMLQSLRRLNDMEGLTKYFKEWESSCIEYDLRLVKTVVSAYLSQGMFEEAELVFKDAMRRQSKGPFFRIHEAFILFYLENRKVDLAVCQLEAALSEVKDNGWSPSPEVMSAFIKCYEEEKVDGVEKLRNIFKTYNFDDSSILLEHMKVHDK